MVRLILCSIVGSVLLLDVPQARAMDFTFEPLENRPGTSMIVAKGMVAPGDDEKLHKMVAALPVNTVLAEVVLSSVGGNYLEGVRLATSIRNTGLNTAAVGNCASACFLMFAAGINRAVFEGAKIGVHSASLRGIEKLETQAVTTQMARKLSDMGVPPSIVGKVVTTPADEIAWLTPEDLAAMKVRLIPHEEASTYQPGSPLRPGGVKPATARPVGPVPMAPVESEQTASARTMPALPPSQAFLDGRKARIDNDAWFNGLLNDYRAGAEWWAAARSQAAKTHANCENGWGTSSPWVQGCRAAQATLTPSDIRRRSEPEFRAGWNSL